MENTLNWINVVHIEGKLVEFVAFHKAMIFRQHEGLGSNRFWSLKNAITSPNNGARKLLQSEHGNANHKNYLMRGPAHHVAVWYADQSWAILMNPEEVTLVQKIQIQAIINDNPSSVAAIQTKLKNLFEALPMELRRPLDKNFYKNTIACNN